MVSSIGRFTGKSRRRWNIPLPGLVRASSPSCRPWWHGAKHTSARITRIPMKNSIEAGLPAKTADRRISRTLLDCMKRLFSGYEKQKRAFTAPYHFPIIFLSILPYTIWQNLYNLAKLQLLPNYMEVLPNCFHFCQIVWGFAKRFHFRQKVYTF